MKQLFCCVSFLIYFSTWSQINYPSSNVDADVLLDFSFDGHFYDESGEFDSIVRVPSITNFSYVEDRFGNPSSAINFTSNQYLKLQGGDKFNYLPSFSISIFVNVRQLSPNTQVIVSKTSPGRDFVLEYDNYGRFRANYTEGSSSAIKFVVNPLPSSINEWHHIALVYDGSTYKLYVDGTLGATRTTVSTSSGGGGNFTIGAFGNGQLNLKGAIDDFKFYNRVLTDLEIYNIANATSAIRKATNELSFSNDNEDKYSIYPNPFSENLFISNISDETSAKFKVYDIEGKEVISEVIQDNFGIIYTNELPSGTYFCKLITESEVLEKIIIKN